MQYAKVKVVFIYKFKSPKMMKLIICNMFERYIHKEVLHLKDTTRDMKYK
jgi:hypothetical protein